MITVVTGTSTGVGKTVATAALAATARGEGEAADLAAVADSVQRYAGLVESARANNRQGFPVGAAYLDQASAALQQGRERAQEVYDQGLQQAQAGLGVAHHSAFGDLQDQPARFHPVQFQRVADLVEQVRGAELDRGQVH